MIQLPLFSREAGDVLAAIRRERSAFQWADRAGGRHLTPPDAASTPPTPLASPHDPLGMAMANAPTGVVDFPRPPAGDPAWERWGLILVDVPRAHRRGLAAHHRRAGER